MKHYCCICSCLIILLICSSCTYLLPKNATLQRKYIKHLYCENNLGKYLTTQQWDTLFPHRFGYRDKDKSINFYAYKSLVSASKLFPDFLTDGDSLIQKRELAAFLANIAEETSGGWKEAPGGYFKWGLYYVEEKNVAVNQNYADTSNKKYPPVLGLRYFGRGPKQLSWNYNYGQFSEAWFGNKDSLLLKPELIAKDPVLSFASAIWFWMTEQYPKPSCHDIMCGFWKPTHIDSIKGRVPGFGATLNVINGGIECGSGLDQEKTLQRYEYYKYLCNYFHVSPGENISCKNQQPFGR